MGLLAGQINKNHKELSLKTFSEKNLESAENTVDTK